MLRAKIVMHLRCLSAIGWRTVALRFAVQRVAPARIVLGTVEVDAEAGLMGRSEVGVVKLLRACGG